ncbi:penicillin-binding protein 1A [Striga asiatica]|uniref:Penicillin-binding protein 1A n=1 Tax=Striga asiatica TaxID=4170 RepID=A0A5A7R5F3_STRAF|nr:penicillin-binding protein 1A [Striga asiatica]
MSLQYSSKQVEGYDLAMLETQNHFSIDKFSYLCSEVQERSLACGGIRFKIDELSRTNWSVKDTKDSQSFAASPANHSTLACSTLYAIMMSGGFLGFSVFLSWVKSEIWAKDQQSGSVWATVSLVVKAVIFWHKKENLVELVSVVQVYEL